MQTFVPTYLILIHGGLFLCLLTGCSANNDNAHTTVTTNVEPPPVQILKVGARPEKIVAMMKDRGEQDAASPVLKIVSPVNDAVINGSAVAIRLSLSGELKGYKPHKEPATGMGNHIHVILDNEPYEAYYDLDQPFELKNVTHGKHTLRVFASRPWHESYKNEGAFQAVSFLVKGSDVTNTSETGTNRNSSGGQGEVDFTKPLLTYSRPKGEYQGDEADPIMIDFWLSNARLKGDGGEYRVRYIVDDDEPRFLDKWEPIWLSGWINGKHTVRLELIGPDQWPLKNGDYNITTHEINVTR